jgi:hypothetical protein
MRTNYSREELIAICERAVVPIEQWGNRDSPSAHEKLGLCWVMLKSGANFTVHRAAKEGESSGCFTNDRTIWLTLHWHNFSDFEYGTEFSESEQFYLPTPERLEATKGRDWY